MKSLARLRAGGVWAGAQAICGGCIVGLGEGVVEVPPFRMGDEREGCGTRGGAGKEARREGECI